MVSLVCCSAREPLINEASRKKVMEKTIKAIKDELAPPYNMSVKMDSSGTRAIVTLWQGNLILLWIACVFGAIFSGCVVMYCCPYYRWRIYVDTRTDDKVDLIFGISANKVRSCVECVLVPICCSKRVKNEYRVTHEAIRGALRRAGVRVADESPDTYEEIMSSKRINDRKFLRRGISSAIVERGSSVV